MRNLLTNAIKFTPSHGSVTVGEEGQPSKGTSPSRVFFSVADTGIGIPPEALESIFESFRQVDGSHTRMHEGTGARD